MPSRAVGARSSPSTARSPPTGSSRPRTATRRVSSPRPCVRELLHEEPYRSYGITLERFFGNGGPREFEDVVGITDRTWGWETDYAQMREAGLEAVRAEPWALCAGRRPARSLDELWSPLHVALPEASTPAPARRRPSPRPPRAGSTSSRLRPRGSRSRRLDRASSRRRRTARSPRSGRPPTDHSLVFSSLRGAAPFRELEAGSGRLERTRTALSRQRVADASVQPLVEALSTTALWLGVGIVAWLWRRPARGSLAAVFRRRRVLVRRRSRRSRSTRSSSSPIPVAPALVVFGAAGLVGRRRASAV